MMNQRVDGGQIFSQKRGQTVHRMGAARRIRLGSSGRRHAWPPLAFARARHDGEAGGAGQARSPLNARKGRIAAMAGLDTTEDAILNGRVRLKQPARGYRVNVDTVLLAAAVQARD